MLYIASALFGVYAGAQDNNLPTRGAPGMASTAPGTGSLGEAQFGTLALATSCTGCHAPSHVGRGAHPPSLYGRRAARLRKQLLAFRDGTRKGTLMPRIMAAYSNDDIHRLADYFSRLPRDHTP